MINHRHSLPAILFALVSYKCYCEGRYGFGSYSSSHDYYYEGEDDEEDHGYLILCENQEENVVCPKNSTINVIIATYGYNTSNKKARQECDSWWKPVLDYVPFTGETDCHNPNSTYIVADMCNGQSQCTVSATNKVFDDPCRGVAKYFELYYNCNQDQGENDTPIITTNISGEKGGNSKLDEDREGGDREGYVSDGNSKSSDDGGLMTTDGYEVSTDISYESNSNSDGIHIENESRRGNDDNDDDNDDSDGDDNDDVDNDDDDDDEEGMALSAVAVVAISAGIPIGVVIIISIIVILACILASPIKRRKTLGATNDSNLSVNQYDGQGLPMTASSNNEDPEMVYNLAYQSVFQDSQSAVKTTGNGKIDEMQINYENLSEVQSTNESANTKDEEAVYNEAYQSINGNEAKR